MRNISVNSTGVAGLEILALLVALILIGGAGVYIAKSDIKHQTAAKSSTKRLSSHMAQSNSNSSQLSLEQVFAELITAYRGGDKVKFDSLVSPGMQAEAKINGNSDVYEGITKEPAAANLFTTIDFSQQQPAVGGYTSKNGLRGEQLTYTVLIQPSTANGHVSSTNVYKFDFVPRDNGWLLDNMELNFNASTNGTSSTL